MSRNTKTRGVAKRKDKATMPAQGESGEAMAQATNSPLAAELAAFDARRAELEKTYPMKFVVFKGDEFVGAWDTLDAAASQAAIRFGRGPYLIRQVGAPRPTLPASVLWRNTALA